MTIEATAACSVRTETVWPLLAGVALLAGVDRRRARRAVDRRRPDRHGAARSGPGHHLRAAVRPRCGRDRRRHRRRLVHVRGVPGAAAAQRCPRCRRYRALRTGTVAAGVWTVCAVLLVPLTVSDITGQPLTSRLRPSDDLVGGQPGRDGGHLALDGAARRDRDRRQHPGAALVVDAAAVRRLAGHPVPIALSGHSSSGGSHDLATNSLLIHLIFGRACGPAACSRCWRTRCAAASTPTWRRDGSPRSPVVLRRDGGVRRGQRAGAGSASATSSPPPTAGCSSPRSSRCACSGCSAGCSGDGAWRRWQADPDAAAPADPARARRGRGVRTDVRPRRRARPHPAAAAAVPTRRSPPVEIGYDLAGPPTFARILFDWRFDLIFGTAAHRARGRLPRRRASGCGARGDAWPVGPDVAWLLRLRGAADRDVVGRRPVLPAMFSVHMAAHMCCRCSCRSCWCSARR